MPSERTHQFFYAIVFALAMFLLYSSGVLDDKLSLGVGFVVGLLGAAFPDVDIGTSRVRKLVSLALLIGVLALLALYQMKQKQEYLWGIAGLIVFLVLLSLSHHRKFCHSLAFLAMTTVAVYLLFRFLVVDYLATNPLIVASCWFGGMFLHLVADGEVKGWFT